jgi:DNA-binding transcriptional ArsR family regulator
MDVFEAISDPSRRTILELLRQGPLNAGEIAAAFPTSRPAISRHLRHLREAGLVEMERSGRHRAYRLRTERLAPLRAWLQAFEPAFPETLLDAFETEVYRTRREKRAEQAESTPRREESA